MDLKKFLEIKPFADATRQYNRVELTAEQSKRWAEVRTLIMWYCPAFSHILYTMLSKGAEKNSAFFTDDDENMPTAATDGSNLIFNINFMSQLSTSQAAWTVCHEIMHAMWNHPGQSVAWQLAGKIHHNGKDLPYSAQLMNMAMDYVINDTLAQAQVGKPVDQIKICWDPKIGTYQESIVDVYAKLLQQSKKGGRGQGIGTPEIEQPDGPFDMVLAPGSLSGKNAQEAIADRDEKQWKQTIVDAMVAARARGRLPACLDKIFGQLTEPKVDWTDKVEGFFNRKVGNHNYNFRRANRSLIVRDIYAPSKRGHTAGTVVVGYDTSGSIFYDGDQLERFAAEIGGMLEDINPERLIVVHCDAAVHKWEEVENLSDVADIKPRGGGGTDFAPVFDWIAEELDDEVDALIYLTDGFGGFPDRAPSYPVLWGDCIGPENVDRYPFGEVVHIPK